MNSSLMLPLLALPLVGGYAFSITWWVSYVNTFQETGRRLYFKAVFYGVFLVVCSALIHLLILTKTQLLTTQLELFFGILSSAPFNYWKLTNSPVFATILCGAFVLGIFLGHILNIPRHRPFYTFRPFLLLSILKPIIIKFRLNFLLPYLKKAQGFRPFYQLQRLIYLETIQSRELEKLLIKSLEKKLPIFVLLPDDTFYVGYSCHVMDTVENRKEIRLIPFITGYRDKETHALTTTTNYYNVLSKLGVKKDSLEHYVPEDFEVVLPVEKIVFSHLFDIRVYKQHFDKQYKTPSTYQQTVPKTDIKSSFPYSTK